MLVVQVPELSPPTSQIPKAPHSAPGVFKPTTAPLQTAHSHELGPQPATTAPLKVSSAHPQPLVSDHLILEVSNDVLMFKPMKVMHANGLGS